MSREKGTFWERSYDLASRIDYKAFLVVLYPSDSIDKGEE
jgi:hypothetical protein